MSTMRGRSMDFGRVQCCSWNINHMTNKWDDEELNSVLEGKNMGVLLIEKMHLNIKSYRSFILNSQLEC
jgi:hypothetical protein